MLAPFDLLIPETLDEALRILSEKGQECKVYAGGTDVFVDMHSKYEQHPYLMDIKRISELKEFEYIPGQGISIGALTTHHFLDRSPVIRRYFPALYEGASQVGSVQIRHRGTIGGNICNAVPSGDTLGPLLALDAKAVISGMNGLREIPLEDFFLGPKKTVLNSGELLVKIVLPDPGKTSSAYIKFTRRGAMDLALLGASASIGLDENGVCSFARISLTTCAPVPMRAKQAEARLIGQRLTDELISEAGIDAAQEARPRSSWRCTEEYRREVLKEIVPRVIHTAMERAKKGVGIE
jgi:CO/xanthine dehydrogenase FAD-binding subunit